jgi:hypothetical protein
VRPIPGFVCLLLLICPALANGQSFQLQGSAGPTIIDAGYSVAAGLGVAAGSRVSFLLDAERTHISSQLRRDERGRVISAFRGGTLTLAAVEVQVNLFPRQRTGPYALAGYAAGLSRPNVNENFPDPVTNDVHALFFGGGFQVPVGEHLHVFADARLLFGEEGIGGIAAALPIRGGAAWRF